MLLEALIAVVFAVLGALWYGRRTGAASERAKQRDRERKAQDISDRIDSDVGALPPSEAREELKRWGR